MLIFGCSLIGMETSLQIGTGIFIVATAIVAELDK